MLKRSYKIPIYHGRLHVIFTMNLKDVEKKYNLLPLDGGLEFDGITFNYKGEYYVAFDTKYFKPHIAAHEAKHVVNDVFRDTGIALDIHNDEAECYFLGWVMRKIYHTHKQLDA